MTPARNPARLCNYVRIATIILSRGMVLFDIMHKYEIIMYWSNEDDAFVAEVPELPGCAAHGDTQEMALAEVKQAMDLWVDTAREFGDPIPEPKGERLMLA